MTAEPINKLWLAARLLALVVVGAVAMLFFTSWIVAVIVGGLTIAAVAVDAWVLSRGEAERVAVDPSSDSAPSRPLLIDLSRRR
ncbi:MAG: hypothetical protein H0T46_26635 [Deltaproteobacteria bacterium]|nr:hypothetical protein [Deltaproteobacteria bacterium]